MSAQRRQRAAHGLPDAFQLTEPRRSFGTVLAAIVAALIFQLAAPSGDLTHFIAIVLQSTVIVLALRAAGFHRRIVRLAAIVLGCVAALVGVAIVGINIAPTAPRILNLILVLLTPAAIVAGVIRELREDKRVTVQTIFCGLSLYLLVGLAFAVLFAAVEDISGQPFFTGHQFGTSNDFLYFSLATLTTVGYGDLTAASDLGRAMAVTEALLGQFYLVTVLAVIVANVRRGSV